MIFSACPGWTNFSFFHSNLIFCLMFRPPIGFSCGKMDVKMHLNNFVTTFFIAFFNCCSEHSQRNENPQPKFHEWKTWIFLKYLSSVFNLFKKRNTFPLYSHKPWILNDTVQHIYLALCRYKIIAIQTFFPLRWSKYL